MRASVSFLTAAALAVLISATAGAQEPGLEALQGAFSDAQLLHMPPPPPTPAPAVTPTPTPAQQGAEDAPIFQTEQFQELSQPDPGTLAWLAQRVPGLDVANVKVVTADAAESVMQQAVNAKATYLDVLTNQFFRSQTLYYVPQDVLNQVNAKYISGTVPIQGTTENNQAFQMQGFLIGDSQVDMLFNLTQFTFKVNGTRYKIANGGRVAGSVLGAGDISVSGMYAYGAPIFCPWAQIQRMTKTSANQIKVQTSCGSKSNIEIDPVTTR